MKKLEDYGESFSVALKNYIEKEWNTKLSSEQSQKLSKNFSISDSIKLSDAIDSGNRRVIRNILLDKFDLELEEGYGVRASQPTPSTTDANRARRANTAPKNQAVRTQRNVQPTGQGARLNVPNQQAQNTMTVQQNQQLAQASNAKADQNKAEIEQLKKMAGVR